MHQIIIGDQIWDQLNSTKILETQIGIELKEIFFFYHFLHKLEII